MERRLAHAWKETREALDSIGCDTDNSAGAAA
jgi:hypothetical protein